MIHYFSPAEIALWLVAIVSQCALLVSLRHSGSWSRYPAFTAYVIFSVIKSAALFYIACHFDPKAYGWAYFPASFFAVLMMLPAIGEVFLMVYGPPRALPAGTWDKVWNLLVMLAGSWLIIGAVLQFTNGGGAARLMMSIERLILGVACITGWTIVVFSRRLGITWRTRIAKVGLGFVLFLSLNWLSAFLRSYSGPELARLARAVGQLGYMAVVLYWTVLFWGKEKAPARSPEIAARLSMQLQETINALGIGQEGI